MPSLNYGRVIHLSHMIDERIPLWPGDPAVELKEVARLEVDGYTLRRLTIGEHSGTHVNAPRTYFPAGASIADMPAESLVRPAAVVDVRAAVSRDWDYRAGVADLRAWEAQHGAIPPGSLVLLFTGWQDRWQNPTEFLPQDEQGMHFPGFDPEGVRFLLEERQIAGVGIDTHGVDGGQDTSFTVNRLVLEQGGMILENLTNLDQLPPLGATLIVGILRLRDGTGSPAAVLALVP